MRQRPPPAAPETNEVNQNRHEKHAGGARGPAARKSYSRRQISVVASIRGFAYSFRFLLAGEGLLPGLSAIPTRKRHMDFDTRSRSEWEAEATKFERVARQFTDNPELAAAFRQLAASARQKAQDHR